MKEYVKPQIEIVCFENTDENLAMISGNYNKNNLRYDGSGNSVNF